MQRVDCVVDDREPSDVVRAFREHPDVASVEVRRLPAADIAVDGIGIERKTVADYVSSALGPTGTVLRDQVEKMTEAYDHTYVLLEGDLRDVGEHWPDLNPAAVHGSMASFAARYDTPVIPCSDRERLVDVAVRLIRKHAEEPSARPLPVGAVTGRTEPTAKRMYGCIEGVGTRTADALYEAFPTVESLVAADRDDLLAVEGVGEKRADAILAALRECE
ncbi:MULTISPECIES: ERCC4 domain-containing protein [Halorussus]|uniref:ERCC4 domain-containing protein n=1 Tax=Halorussus TaxID=1070314 RepID=UPI00209D0CBD|nr:ERCC4 domain-containing protein [Halorussus vallis]USZ77355.1 helix-hairpin-helix domain-containing protein [Halorussus vallis]